MNAYVLLLEQLAHPAMNAAVTAARLGASIEHGLACVVLQGMRQQLGLAGRLGDPRWNHEQRLVRLVFLVGELLTDWAPDTPVRPAFAGQALFMQPNHYRPMRLPTMDAAIGNCVRVLGWMSTDPQCRTGLVLTASGEIAQERTKAAMGQILLRDDWQHDLEAPLGRWARMDLLTLNQQVLKSASQRVRHDGAQARLVFAGPKFLPLLRHSAHA